MKRITIARRIGFATAVVGLGSAAASAHGPTVVLTDVGGQIVTNQLDVTPQADAASSADYPVGAPARVFPADYDPANLATFATGSYAANTPQNMQAIPMTYVNVANDTTKDSGYYGQLEATDAVGNNTLETGPGYAYGNGGFAAGAVFQITFARPLQYWTGSAFGNTPDGEQLQAIRGSSITPGTGFANTLTSSGVQGGTGLQVSVTASQNAGSHSQLMYRLTDAAGDSTDVAGIADGLYLASFDVGTASTSSVQLTGSLPYYFLFEKDVNNDVTAAQVTAAVNSLTTGVPEPTGTALLALGLGIVAGRRVRTSTR